MKKNYFGLPLTIAAIILSTTLNLQAQVTIGSEIAPTKAALLELKTQQKNATDITSVDDIDNVTSTTGGLLLPRVKLVSTTTMQPFIDPADPEWTSTSNKLKERLAGLMVYNLTTAGGVLYPGVWVWNGTQWVTSDINLSSIIYISEQPKAFTFYETGEETPAPLVFTASGGESPFTYQWYRITGNNVHVRVAVPLSDDINAWGTGTASEAYTLGKSVLKGTTRKAVNTGFYRFYCVAKNAAGDSLVSEVAEVAVGCGAKNKEGKWLSFMCFNLGANNNATINYQKTYSITFSPENDPTTGLHTYVSGEEDVYGDLFQWGRIADGHEDRNVNNNPAEPASGLTVSDIGNGNKCSHPSNADTPRPYYQVKQGTKWYGKFISGPANWNPTDQSIVDQLWRSGRFTQNDPCAHYKSNDGSYQLFWHTGTDNTNGSEACSDAGTGWRIPTQPEWGELYRGGTIFGSPDDADADTWYWNKDANKPHGFEVRPDNVTTTLFFPFAGFRGVGTGLLYNQGTNAYYWSSGTVGTNAYALYIYGSYVGPATGFNRSYGFSLRCIKN
jgi:uncharacterized protein (TIGR02145 family)